MLNRSTAALAARLEVTAGNSLVLEPNNRTEAMGLDECWPGVVMPQAGPPLPRGLLAVASRHTGQHYDLAGLYVGTVHALCRRLLLDRRLHPDRQRGQVPALRDELSQYLSIYRPARWNALTEALGLNNINDLINELFTGRKFSSRHAAVTHCLSLFNRLSEECLDPPTLVKTLHQPAVLNHFGKGRNTRKKSEEWLWEVSFEEAKPAVERELETYR